MLVAVILMHLAVSVANLVGCFLRTQPTKFQFKSYCGVQIFIKEMKHCEKGELK